MSLSNVVVAPAFAHTLLSVSTLTNKRDVNVTFNKTRGFFNFSDHKISLPVGNDGLYRLHFDVIPPTGSVPKQVPRAYVVTTGDIDVQIQRLHKTLGHPSLKRMKGIVKQSFSSPVSAKLRKAVLSLDGFSCDDCFKGKAVSQTAPQKSEPKEYEPGGHFSTDIAGPFPVQRGGYKYFIVWADHRTKIYFILF